MTLTWDEPVACDALTKSRRMTIIASKMITASHGFV
jgi:hypothetical protein